MANDTSTNVAVYIVWSPQVGAKEKHVGSAAGLVPDPRARHYWDGERLIGTAYQPILGLSAPAWDVWMLFDKAAVWRENTPPKPAWWEHQLSAGPSDLHLDPKRFAERAKALQK